METKARSMQLERLRVRMGFEGLFSVDRVGLGGGLALLWRESGMATLLSYSDNYIDVIVTMEGESPWRLTCFYGFPERARRHQAWTLLRDLKSHSNLPWVVIGDFNDIASHSEKRGHISHPDNLIRGFNDTLQDCALFDLGMQGHKFTWERGRGSEHWVEEQLDRAVASSEWRELYGNAKVLNILATSSDHSAIFLDLKGRPVRRVGRRFKFESAWLLDAQCRDVVEASWRQSFTLDFPCRIHACSQDLRRWGSEHFCNFGRKVHALRSRLESLRNSRSANDIRSFKEFDQELRLLLAQEESFWPIVGADLTSFVTSCFANCALPPGLNDTNVVLIPKKKVPERTSDLRPIALCNVAYKVLAKVIANRLKEVLHLIISQSQSAFVPDRLITDNIIVAGEIGHYLKRKRAGNIGWAALKVDMAKAYDRMEWGFLEGTLRALGFARDWIDLIRLCVTSVKYEILVNGETVGSVLPSRGIRQGDPLSPYIFIICAEGLSLILQQQEASGKIHGIRVVRGAPSVSHLFFADDSLLFFRATDSEVHEIKSCLDLYSSASGQLVNYDKSSITFSANTEQNMCRHVASVLGVRQSVDFGRYLGLPSFIGRNKTAVFRYVEQRMRDRINSWQKQFLNKAGKEVLLKSVGQSMPIFTMSVFLLLIGVCDSIEKMMNRFWWNKGKGAARGLHWLSWSRLATPKSSGGIGFKKIHEFNIALLAKQGWRLLVNPQSLVSRILKAKYFPNVNFLEATLGNNPSYIWRSILSGQEVLREGVARRVGNGKDTPVWGCPWLLDNVDPYVTTACINELRDARVHNLLDSNGCWDYELLHDIFDVEDIPRIVNTPVSPAHPDAWYWKGDLKGQYTIKHGYKLLVRNTLDQDSGFGFREWRKLWSSKIPPKVEWRKLWSSKIPPKVRNFLWRCVKNILPVREVLRTKGVVVSGGCPLCPSNFETVNHIFPLCPSNFETVNHIFCECPIASQLWSGFDLFDGVLFVDFVSRVLNAADITMTIFMASRLWAICTTRNEIIWNAYQLDFMALRRLADDYASEWQQAILTTPSPVTNFADPTPLWNPPPFGFLKCNIDAALHADSVGFGAVIRNHEGNFVAAYGGHLQCPRDPYVAESMAVKEALTWIKSRYLNNVIVESDCLNFCSSFNSVSQDFSYVGLIVKQCRLIANDIGNIVVRHVKRSANHIAHVLARATGSSSVLGFWDVIPPDCISIYFDDLI
ncbi:uncharacterized protein LOC115998904 [Ipomoea triloba]|uniref:uncharacterized protein LOC115998904 n=1 Tax=Ipomoea triloba TaxID=35885 RepID=UPI00125E463B|nr:uncharacterized protein LOC115998904 [Ipomoea triloba]